MIKRLNEILDTLKGEEKIILSVAVAEDKEVLQAIKDAVEKDVIEPILIGDENKIKLLADDIGFNLIGTAGTSAFLKANGIRCKTVVKLDEGDEMIKWIRSGHVKYVINTMTNNDNKVRKDGFEIRRESVEHNIPTLTSLDTVRILLDVLESITIKVSIIND